MGSTCKGISLEMALSLFKGGWEIEEDRGIVDCGGYKKRVIVLKCTFCGYVKEIKLGHLHTRITIKKGRIRCNNCALHKVDPDKIHPLSSCYSNMMRRCYDFRSKGYMGHGAKGITVCELWRNNKKEFYRWAFNNGWKVGLFLDRKDNEKGYTPENCRWVTPRESCLNRGNFKNNTLGEKYISPYKNPRSSKHRFQVRVDHHRIGYFDTLQLAIKARDEYLKQKHEPRKDP